MRLNWNFLGGGSGGCKTEKLSVGRVWIFFGTALVIRNYIVCNIIC